MAGVVLMLYDYLLTLDDEIQYIWKENWTIGKGLFLIVCASRRSAVMVFSLAYLESVSYPYRFIHPTSR